MRLISCLPRDDDTIDHIYTISVAISESSQMVVLQLYFVDTEVTVAGDQTSLLKICHRCHSDEVQSP